MPITTRVILDTDLGSDVDDAMAFSQLLGSPDVDIVGVTTVYGDTVLRARLTQRLAGLAGTSVRVYAGEQSTLSGREVWWPGHEGSLHSNLEAERVEDGDAVDFLVNQVASHPGQIDVIAIGPLTNIAGAIRKDPTFAQNVKHLWVMGGAFTAEGMDPGSGTNTEHNFRSDDIATKTVFDSGIAATVTGLEVTQKVEVRTDQIAEFAAAGPLGLALERDIHQWWEFWDEEWNVPHDPITVLTLLRPELFSFSEPGSIEIRLGDSTTDDNAGHSTFTPGTGSVRIATDLDSQSVADEIVRAIVAAASVTGSEHPTTAPASATPAR
jgi:inosine-uridine nucleoside N-ribohydrolase